MKAVVFHGVGDIRLDDVPEPTIKDPTDAIVRLTSSAICGTDLHMIRGTMPGMKPGTILGHEGVGVVEEVGRGDVVAVWGCGPVGLFSVLSAFQKGAHRVIAVDGHEDRLERARMLGAE